MKPDYSGRRRRFGRASLSVSMAVIVIAAVLLINVLFSVFASRELWFIDLTTYTRDKTQYDAAGNKITVGEDYELYTLTPGAIELLGDTLDELNATRQNKGEEPVEIEIIFCDDPDNLMSNMYRRLIYMTALCLQKQFPDAEFALLEENSVDPSMGFSFLLKCLVAVGIASLLMVLYVALRFRKIGGFSAGVFALVALFHDVAMIFFMYVIFRWPIDSNFIAVVLMILGYSLNDTIVIYDRVREQRKLMGRKVGIDTVFNVSATKTIKRTIMTSVTTLVAIMTVFIVASVFNISSVKGFALPMMIGVISGCYSSICIAGPLWVIWQNRKAKK